MMKPSCTALVSAPRSAVVRPHVRWRSSAAALALNQSEVPKNSAMTMTATAARDWSVLIAGNSTWPRAFRFLGVLGGGCFLLPACLLLRRADLDWSEAQLLQLRLDPRPVADGDDPHFPRRHVEPRDPLDLAGIDVAQQARQPLVVVL